MENETQKFIYTDSYLTKQQIWESYDGYLEHYTLYKTYKQQTGSSPDEHIFGMNRHSISLWIVIKRLLEKDFKKDFEKEVIKIKQIIKQTKKDEEDYDYLMEVYDKFMHVTGIKNITIERDDLNEAIKNSR